MRRYARLVPVVLPVALLLGGVVAGQYATPVTVATTQHSEEGHGDLSRWVWWCSVG